MEYSDMPIVILTGPDDIGACPNCGCNGAMGVGCSDHFWFRCYRCETDWRVPEIDWTTSINNIFGN